MVYLSQMLSRKWVENCSFNPVNPHPICLPQGDFFQSQSVFFCLYSRPEHVSIYPILNQKRYIFKKCNHDDCDIPKHFAAWNKWKWVACENSHLENLWVDLPYDAVLDASTRLCPRLAHKDIDHRDLWKAEGLKPFNLFNLFIQNLL